MTCNPSGKRGFSVLELCVVLIIAALLSVLGWSGWMSRLEQEYAQNARTVLKMVWQAEQNYFSWRNSYTDDWGVLAIDDPNRTDTKYAYDITNATDTGFVAEARRRTTGEAFYIDESEKITHKK